MTGAYPNPTITTNAVTTAKILDANITTSKLADASVTNAKLNSTGASSGQALTFNGTNVVWGSPSLSGAASGDLSGTFPNPNVAKLQGRDIASTLPTNGQALVWNQTLTRWEPTNPSLGDVVGPSSAIDNAVARYDLTTGKLIQNSTLIVDDFTTSTQNNVTLRTDDGATANIDLVLSPKGNGALVSNKPNGASSGGDARGQYAVDLQMSRSGSNQVAGGDFGTISGGNGNRITTGLYSTIAGGNNNIVIGDHAVISGGNSNQATFFATSIGGGYLNSAQSNYSSIPGGYGLRFSSGGADFGYNAWANSYQDSATISAAQTAYFGNVDVWLGNTRNQASKLKFFTAQATGGAFPLGTTYFTAFQAGVQSADISYTLPTASPSINGQVLSSTTGGVLSWTSAGGGDVIGPASATDNAVSRFDAATGKLLQNSAILIDDYTTSIQNNVTLKADDAATADINLVLSPKGTGGLMANKPDAATSGGNARGRYTVDLQMSRSAATQVAKGDFSTISGGTDNTVDATNSTVSGGSTNSIGATASNATISGGVSNTITNGGNTSTTVIGGGGSNTIGNGASACDYSVIVGGSTNTITSFRSFVGGGTLNAISSAYASIGGGDRDSVSGNWATIGGGLLNKVTAQASTVAGGNQNIATGTESTVGGGLQNMASGSYSTVAGGNLDTSSGAWSTIGGGYLNKATASTSTIAGGYQNTASGNQATVSGGLQNLAIGVIATVGGGQLDTASGFAAVASGGQSNKASGDYSFVGSGVSNYSTGFGSIVVGGQENVATANYSVTGGGHQNTANGFASFLGGGINNKTVASYTFIGGGGRNFTTGFLSSIVGGQDNNSGAYSSILGGSGLTISGSTSLGFLSSSSVGVDQMIISANNTVVFGNANLWLANNNNTAKELRFYEAQNSTGTFPAASTNYTAFVAGVQTVDITYTLPTAYPTSTGRPLTSTLTGTLSWGKQSLQLLNQNVDCANLGANGGTAFVDVAVTGAVVGSTVTVSPRGDMENGVVIASARVSAADNVRIKFVNATVGAIDPAAVNFDITVVQP